MVDGNKLGDVGFEKIGTPYRQMDCQAFVEWCLRQCGFSLDLAGANAWYRYIREHGAIMSPEECVKQFGCVPKGAILFIHAFDGGEEKRGYHDGLGNASHMGICTMPRGEGAIHSSSSRGCVAESVFKGRTINGGWNCVGLPDFVSFDYGGGGGVTPSPEPTPTPEPEPEPEPDPVYAIVSSNGNGPVNTRKGPGTSYPLSKAGKLPEGTEVEVLKTEGDWSYIRTIDSNKATWYCWIKSEYLIVQDSSYPPVPDIPDPVPDPDTGDDDDGDITIVMTLTRAEAQCILPVIERMYGLIAAQL